MRARRPDGTALDVLADTVVVAADSLVVAERALTDREHGAAVAAEQGQGLHRAARDAAADAFPAVEIADVVVAAVV